MSHVAVLERPAFMLCPLAPRLVFPVERVERDPVAREASMALDSFGPAVIASSRPEPPERISSAQPVT